MKIPTFQSLYTSIQSDLRNRLGLFTIIGKAVLNAFALVQTAKLKIYYSALKFFENNSYPDLANPESEGGTLTRFGVVKLGREPEPPTAGEYDLTVTGTIGATIPANTTLKSLDTSANPDKIFILDTLFTFTSTSGTISVRAVDLGSDAALEVADELQFTSPITDVDSFAEVAAITTTPTDGESSDEYREKVLAAYRTETQGGAFGDYRIWASDVTQVREVYPELDSPGIINLYVEANPADSTPVNSGIPSAAILSDVEDVILFDPDTTLSIEDRGRKPVTVFDINYEPVNTLDVDVTITGLSDASYAPAIESAIEDLLFDIRPYIAGADDPNNSNKGLLLEADIYGIVRDTIGNNATFTSLQLSVDGTPSESYTFTAPDIPILNSVSV